MALYIPHSIFHLARLLYVRLETFGPYYVLLLELLTAWSEVLLEKPTGSQLDKKFPTFYGTRMFITAFTRANCWNIIPKCQ